MEAVPRPREILLVEDNPIDVLILQKYLPHLAFPYHLSVVSDGDAGLAFLQRQGLYREAPIPDLILLDIHLPQRTGWDILKWVKATPSVALIPVVMMSTFLAPYDEQARDYLHPSRCFEKPTSGKKFHDLLKSFEELLSHNSSSVSEF
jgi:two-component system, chemotaxis family, response regulator Rcp1